ncbi:MAG TPA: hypothetical protein VD836_05100 [Solirubrobacteraceae bacterium]|nr:hypothetical protein [Solirubrobacteraceae bacterium]
MTAPAHLLVYGFSPGAEFEGRLVGAIERIERGGTLRVLEVLFVMRDAASGEVVATHPQGRGEGSLVAPLLGFRLDPAERSRMSEQALRADDDSDVVRRLGEALEPGAAVAAVLVEHRWVAALEDAVARTGGRLLAGELVGEPDAGTADMVLEAVRGARGG